MAAASASPQLPYERHDGRELALMLAGVKPLAVFETILTRSEAAPPVYPEFEPHVRDGLLVAETHIELWTAEREWGDEIAIGRCLRLFARQEEGWRIPAYLLVLKAATGHRWSDSMERCIGSLLGYSDEQNSAWLCHVRRTRGAWGAVPAYLAVTRRDSIEIEKLGFKAFPTDLEMPMTVVLTEQRPDASIWTQPVVVRFGLDTGFAMALEADVTGDQRIVRLGPDAIPALNLNLTTSIEFLVA